MILPKRNEKDLEDVSENVRKEMQFLFVETVDQALEHALEPRPGQDAQKTEHPANDEAAAPARKRAAAS